MRYFESSSLQNTDILYDLFTFEKEIPLPSSVLHDTMINALTSINSLQTQVLCRNIRVQLSRVIVAFRNESSRLSDCQ